MKLSKTLMLNAELLSSSKKAFTLAEVLITLSILGVVAALTLTSLVNRNSDVSAQVKLKKAIATYERVTGAYFAESDQNDLSQWLGTNCKNAKNYFKIGKKIADCQFLTTDGTFWVFEPGNGTALLFDSDVKPRYGVLVWTVDGNVNSSTETPSASSQMTRPSKPNTTKEPVHGYYNAKTFMTTSGASLTDEYGSNSSSGLSLYWED